jgi:hypothetical protein
MFRTEYYSINDNRIKEVRMRNKEIAKNYCEFLKYWLENGKNKMTDIELTYEIITHKEKSKNNYFKNAWDSKHYNKMKSYTLDKIDKKIKKENAWELKRGLGLMLEHSLVEKYKDMIIPREEDKQVGERAIDFYLLREINNKPFELWEEFGSSKVEKTYIFDAIDLKICFGEKPRKTNNKSIYNVEVVLQVYEIVRLLNAILNKNKKEFNSILELIYDRMREELKKRDKEIKKYYLYEYEKNSPSCELREFDIITM